MTTKRNTMPPKKTEQKTRQYLEKHHLHLTCLQQTATSKTRVTPAILQEMPTIPEKLFLAITETHAQKDLLNIMHWPYHLHRTPWTITKDLADFLQREVAAYQLLLLHAGTNPYESVPKHTSFIRDTDNTFNMLQYHVTDLIHEVLYNPKPFQLTMSQQDMQYNCQQASLYITKHLSRLFKDTGRTALLATNLDKLTRGMLTTMMEIHNYLIVKIERLTNYQDTEHNQQTEHSGLQADSRTPAQQTQQKTDGDAETKKTAEGLTPQYLSYTPEAARNILQKCRQTMANNKHWHQYNPAGRQYEPAISVYCALQKTIIHRYIAVTEIIDELERTPEAQQTKRSKQELHTYKKQQSELLEIIPPHYNYRTLSSLMQTAAQGPKPFDQWNEEGDTKASTFYQYSTQSVEYKIQQEALANYKDASSMSKHCKDILQYIEQTMIPDIQYDQLRHQRKYPESSAIQQPDQDKADTIEETKSICNTLWHMIQDTRYTLRVKSPSLQNAHDDNDPESPARDITAILGNIVIPVYTYAHFFKQYVEVVTDPATRYSTMLQHLQRAKDRLNLFNRKQQALQNLTARQYLTHSAILSGIHINTLKTYVQAMRCANQEIPGEDLTWIHNAATKLQHTTTSPQTQATDVTTGLYKEINGFIHQKCSLLQTALRAQSSQVQNKIHDMMDAALNKTVSDTIILYREFEALSEDAENITAQMITSCIQNADETIADLTQNMKMVTEGEPCQGYGNQQELLQQFSAMTTKHIKHRTECCKEAAKIHQDFCKKPLDELLRLADHKATARRYASSEKRGLIRTVSDFCINAYIKIRYEVRRIYKIIINVIPFIRDAHQDRVNKKQEQLLQKILSEKDCLCNETKELIEKCHNFPHETLPQDRQDLSGKLNDSQHDQNRDRDSNNLPRC